jgi:hypothetical protein
VVATVITLILFKGARRKMKTVILLETDELKILRVLLHDAKINLDKCDVSFRLGEAQRKIEEAIKILNGELEAT